MIKREKTKKIVLSFPGGWRKGVNGDRVMGVGSG